LQRGLQANLDFDAQSAAFFRVYQYDGDAQTALVLLNKSDTDRETIIDRWLSRGDWRDAMSSDVVAVTEESPTLIADVPAHGVRVFLFDAPNNDPELAVQLDRLQAGARRRAAD